MHRNKIGVRYIRLLGSASLGIGEKCIQALLYMACIPVEHLPRRTSFLGNLSCRIQALKGSAETPPLPEWQVALEVINLD